MSRRESIRMSALKALAAAAAILIVAVSVFGDQEEYVPGSGKWEFGLTAGAAFPMGAFRNNLGTIGFNADLFIGRRLGHSPFSLGIDIYYMIYGFRSHDQNLSGDIPVQVEVDTSNNMLQGLIYLRCQPRRGRVRPYVEGLVGGSYLYTRTSISGTNFPWDEITSSTNFDDFTVCAGGGAGLDVHLSGGGRSADGTPKAEVRLDCKVRYLLGGRAQYLRSDSIVYDSERETFTYLFRESTTNLLSAQVGISFNF